MDNVADTLSSEECEMLIAKVKLGSNEAFQRLYELTSPKVYGFLQKMLGNQSIADDVMQEAYVKLWQTCNKYDANRGTVIAWIYTLARYQALDTLRADKNHSRTPKTDNDLLFQLPEAFDDTDIYHCLQQLAETQRTGIFATFFHGWTYNELAERMATPLGTVKSRIRRGLERLRECLEQ